VRCGRFPSNDDVSSEFAAQFGPPARDSLDHDQIAMPDDRSDGLRGRDLLGLGGLLAGSVVGCTAIGLVIDHLAGSGPVGTLVGVAVGIVLGAIGFAVRVRRALQDMSK